MTNSLFQISSKDILAVHWTDSMEKAFLLMRSKELRHLPVVDDSRGVVGMLSDRDVHRAMQIDWTDFRSGETPRAEFDPQAKVRDYMSWPVETIDVSDSIADVAKLMTEKKISSLLVVRGNQAVGIVTSEDLLKTLIDAHESSRVTLKEKVTSAIYDSPIGSIAHALANVGV